MTLLTREQTAIAYHVSVDTIRRWESLGLLEAVRLGKRRFYDADLLPRTIDLALAAGGGAGGARKSATAKSDNEVNQ